MHSVEHRNKNDILFQFRAREEPNNLGKLPHYDDVVRLCGSHIMRFVLTSYALVKYSSYLTKQLQLFYKECR